MSRDKIFSVKMDTIEWAELDLVAAHRRQFRSVVVRELVREEAERIRRKERRAEVES